MTQSVIPTNSRTAVYERDGWECQMPTCLCPDGRVIDPATRGTGTEWSPTVDHIIPRWLYGSDSPENLRTAHKRCNEHRGGDGHDPGGDDVFPGNQGSRWS